MKADLLLAALLGGLATYLIRLLPILAGERLKGRSGPPWLRRFLLALGPAAIAALLVLSLKDLLPAQAGRGAAVLAIALGAAAVLATLRLSRNPALATLAGAVAYGLARAVTLS
jgi:Branched-chain amino acid transport protein (AzlD).